MTSATAAQRGGTVLVDPSGYRCDRNLGDMAMLVAALSRLDAWMPGARVNLLTRDVERTSQVLPGVQPVDATGRDLWGSSHPICGYSAKRLPRPFGLVLEQVEGRIRRTSPGTFGALLKLARTFRGKDVDATLAIEELIKNATGLIVSGQGGINDEFYRHALGTLAILERAQRQGRPTLMFGQGIGPITNPKLKSRCREVLPKVDHICLRESQFGPPFLRSIGVPEEKFTVTGDDAIELSNSFASEEIGTGLGVNVRVARYSAVNALQVEEMGRQVTRFAAELDAPIIGLPVRRDCPPDDNTSIRELVKDVRGQVSLNDTVSTPEQLAEQVSRCRVVVTGSYHAGVFALSQGLPVVGVYAQEYYRQKFLGLAEMFPGGLTAVDIAADDAPQELGTALRSAWSMAEELRPRLLARASEQASAANRAFEACMQRFLPAQLIAC